MIMIYDILAFSSVIMMFMYPVAMLVCYFIGTRKEGVEKPLWYILALLISIQMQPILNGKGSAERGQRAGEIIRTLTKPDKPIDYP